MTTIPTTPTLYRCVSDSYDADCSELYASVEEFEAMCAECFDGIVPDLREIGGDWHDAAGLVLEAVLAAKNGNRYKIEAIREHDGGMREGVSCCANLGEAHGATYATRAEAEAEAEHLRESWQTDWDMGECPTYAVEEV